MILASVAHHLKGLTGQGRRRHAGIHEDSGFALAGRCAASAQFCSGLRIFSEALFNRSDAICATRTNNSESLRPSHLCGSMGCPLSVAAQPHWEATTLFLAALHLGVVALIGGFGLLSNFGLRPSDFPGPGPARPTGTG